MKFGLGRMDIFRTNNYEAHQDLNIKYQTQGNRNNSNKVKGLYYVGASTTPGTGLPMVTLSGKLVSDRINHDLS